jgi:3-dehydrosphinganine reductase
MPSAVTLVIATFIILALLLLLFVYLISKKAIPVQWNGAHVIITGGSSGIGLCIAMLAIKRGSNVTLIARNKDKLQQAKEQLERLKVTQTQLVLVFSADVADLNALKKCVADAASANNNKIDLLIASAGETRPERFDEVDPMWFERLMRINYLGVVYSILSVLPYMKQQRHGRVVVVGSLLSLLGCPGYSPYAPTKYAVRGLLDCLDSEFQPYNIAFQLAIPADVNTPMFVEEQKIKPPETKEFGEPPVKPEDVALAIVQGVDHFTYFIPIGFNSKVMTAVAGGLSPASFHEALFQIFTASFLRLLAIQQNSSYYKAVKKYRLIDEKKKKQ